jgi:hypothetical protein
MHIGRLCLPPVTRPYTRKAPRAGHYNAPRRLFTYTYASFDLFAIIRRFRGDADLLYEGVATLAIRFTAGR